MGSSRCRLVSSQANEGLLVVKLARVLFPTHMHRKLQQRASAAWVRYCDCDCNCVSDPAPASGTVTAAGTVTNTVAGTSTDPGTVTATDTATGTATDTATGAGRHCNW